MNDALLRVGVDAAKATLEVEHNVLYSDVLLPEAQARRVYRPAAPRTVAGVPARLPGGPDVRYYGAAMSWEDQAENWLAWARTPGHDAYWSYRDAFFPLLPAPGRRTLEVGCGEGRVARRRPRTAGGRFASREADAAFIVSGSYLGPRRPFEGTEERAGLEMTFRGWCYPLEAYARAFEDTGFLVETLREPVDPRNGVRQGRRLRWFLMGRCVKPR
jgi:hypothetical protein